MSPSALTGIAAAAPWMTERRSRWARSPRRRFTGMPLLLGAKHPTSPSRRQSQRRTAGRRSPGPTAVLISSTGNQRSSGDAVEFVTLMRQLRPARRLGGEPDVRDRHHEIPCRTHRVSKVGGRDLNHYTPPAKTTAGPNNRLHASRLVVSRL